MNLDSCDGVPGKDTIDKIQVGRGKKIQRLKKHELIGQDDIAPLAKPPHLPRNFVARDPIVLLQDIDDFADYFIWRFQLVVVENLPRRRR